MKKVLAIISLIILSIIFFCYYEISFDYYEGARADSIADYIVLPILSFFLLFLIVTGIQSAIRKKYLNKTEFIKDIIYTIATMSVLHFVFLRNLISGIILFVNSNIGTQNQVVIAGLVTSKYQSAGKIRKYELNVLTKTKLYEFDLSYNEIDKYSVDSTFQNIMIKGCLGFVYK